MARGNGSGFMYEDPYSHMNWKDGGDSPESGPLFFGWDEVNRDHLKTGNKFESANTDINGLFGGPTPGEENPFGLGGGSK